jgi:mono/diheme cytochrome c family protein
VTSQCLVLTGGITGSSSWEGQDPIRYPHDISRQNLYFVARGLEATPIVEEGVIYTTGSWSVVFAFDARTGKMKWTYDPQVPRERAYFFCCDVVNRGVALHNGKVYVGTLDGRLIALDKLTGTPAWKVQTTDPAKAYSIAAAPVIARDKVLIGNAGSEYGVRGYITAYDAETGKQVWRFYTVPENPNKGFESKAMEIAAKTWLGKDWWQAGGGGTPWEGASYDPDGITWASGVDPKTGRPIEFPGVGDANPKLLSPESTGAHNWNPMAFHPSTGLVYFPARVGTQMVHVPNRKWKYDPNRDNVGIDGNYEGPLFAKMASMPPPSGELLAWDPIAQKAAWVANGVSDRRCHDSGGGVEPPDLLAVRRRRRRGASHRRQPGFPGARGRNLRRLSRYDGAQYVTVVAGWGGAAGLINAPAVGAVKPGWGRILTFALDGKAILKAPPFGHKNPPRPAITAKQDAQTVHAGALLFNSHCFLCHGLNAVAGPLPDLRYSSKDVLDSLPSIILGGARASGGMPSYKEILSEEDVKAIRAYIIARAQEAARPTPLSQGR